MDLGSGLLELDFLKACHQGVSSQASGLRVSQLGYGEAIKISVPAFPEMATGAIALLHPKFTEGDRP